MAYGHGEAAQLEATLRPGGLRSPGRSHAGEADAWRALDPRTRKRLRRYLTTAPTAPGIDQVATWLGVTVDEAWSWWIGRAGRAGAVRREAAAARRYANNAELVRGDLVRAADLVGPPEIADRLGVELQTVHQWRYRRIMPAPVAIVATTVAVWEWSTIDQWARDTGRLALADLASDAVGF